MDMAQSQFAAALAMVEREDAPAEDKAQMLMDMARGLQQQARGETDYKLAARLFGQALDWAAAGPALLRARIRAARAEAASMAPDAGLQDLEHARDEMAAVLPTLREQGEAVEAAAAAMALGLILQSLAGLGRATLAEAIAAYQQALRVFTAQAWPLEFALLHNNLATAYQAMPAGSPGARMAEALAVQSFEAALAALDRRRHPREYAMLQNNLGNALQYAASGHPLQNQLRAIEAYEDALTIRSERDSPVEFASTMANLGNCLGNLPPGAVDFDARARAQQALAAAERIFRAYGQFERADLVAGSRAEAAT